MLSLASLAQDTGLWLLTAKITVSYSMQRDTLISFMAGNKKWDIEKHATVRSVSSGVITAVIENQAESPDKDFVFDSEAGDPVKLTCTGQGSHSESSKYLETIDGTMVNAVNRDINVSGASVPNAAVQFYFSDDSKSVSISTGINTKGSDRGRMFNGEWKDFGGDIDHYFISCAGGCDGISDNKCKIIKTGSGYQATWKSSENKQRHSVDGTAYINSETTLDITISPYKEPDKPEVSLYGCSELGTEEQTEVMASGKPEGGKFRFWVEPGNLLNVESDGESSAILSGATPGKGTLYVEYTTPEGKTNTASKPASFVKIENYNGGQEIPQIALFDIDGKKLSGVLKIPVAAQPSNLEELVDFVPADKTVLSAVGLPGAVELTGSKEGNTTLQAKTNCGHATGPTVEVEVVNCDKETVEALERMKQAAIENLQDAAENLKKVTGSKEFEKARDDLTASTIELLAKAGLTIISSGKTPSGVVNTATKIAEAGAAISEMIASGSQGEFYENAVKTAFEEINGDVAGAITGVVDVYRSAKRFGENVGQILYHEDVLKSAMESWDKADRDLKRIEKLQQICKGDKTEPQKTEKPKADPTPEPAQPKPPVEPKPGTDTPPAQEQPTEQPTPEPGDEEPPISPPPPTSEPRQVGLPYSPGECGCEKTKSIGVNSADFTTLQTGIKNIGDCVEKFNSVSVTDYLNTLNELSAVTDSFRAAINKDPAIFEVKAKEVKPQLDSLVERTKAYDAAGQTFMKQFEKCPESVTTGMEVLKSAITVTVDSVKTKY
jgi:hypothetical protein